MNLPLDMSEALDLKLALLDRKRELASRIKFWATTDNHQAFIDVSTKELKRIAKTLRTLNAKIHGS